MGKKDALAEYAPRSKQIAYRLNGITYLPHYRKPWFFVGPGFGRHNNVMYLPEELTGYGARPVEINLWERDQ